MSAKHKRNQNSFFRRPKSPGATGKTILIVTEGEKTEPYYFRGLRDRLRLHAVDIEITPADGTDPLSVVNHALKLRDERKRAAKRGCTVAYDEVWAVFDSERADTNPKLNDAFQKAKSNKIKIALSNPCFEFWLLLHDEFTTAPFTYCAEVIKRIKSRYLPDYEKGMIPVNIYIPKIPSAVRYAEQCREHHRTAGVGGNPSTDVDLLVREMNSATRSYYRLDLATSAK